jgi:hypothetical protein
LESFESFGRHKMIGASWRPNSGMKSDSGPIRSQESFRRYPPLAPGLSECRHTKRLSRCPQVIPGRGSAPLPTIAVTVGRGRTGELRWE